MTKKKYQKSSQKPKLWKVKISPKSICLMYRSKNLLIINPYVNYKINVFIILPKILFFRSHDIIKELLLV